MQDFVDLKVQFGVGDYHLNRYRVVFTGPPGKTSAMLAQEFVNGFPTFFSSPYANVERTSKRFGNSPTLKFHGFMRVLGIDLGHPHHDWVVQGWSDPNLGFTAQTLQRRFLDKDDGQASLAAGGGTVLGTVVAGPAGGLIADAAGGDVVGANLKPFLEGRRSWKLTEGTMFGLPQPLHVLETAAVERFSCRTYQASNIGGMTENKIPPIWIANLANFVDRPGFQVIPQPITSTAPLPGGAWTQGRSDKGFPVNYLRMNFTDLKSLMGSNQFHDTFYHHPNIIDRNAQAPGFWGKLERATAF